MKKQDSYRIGPGLREKLRDVVRTVDALAMSNRGLSQRTAHQDIPRSSSAFRVCTFTGGWEKGATKTVAFKYQTDTPNTVVAVNLFAEIATSSSSTRDCAIARDGSTWVLIAAEC